MFIISAIIRKLVEKELKKQMEKFIQPVLDLIKALVQPESGTKFLITVAGLAAIYFLQAKAIGNDATTISIAAIVAAYYIADIFHKLRKKENGQ